MFHATIRPNRDALHVIGEVDPYNVQTLQEHLRGRDADGRAVSLRIRLSTHDEHEFARYARRWLQRLTSRGVRVEVHVEPPGRRIGAASSVDARTQKNARCDGR